MKSALSAVSRFVDRRQSLVFPAPAVAVLFLIVLLPIAFNLYLTFTKWTIGLGQPRFIGFDNFIELFGDERVWNGVKVMVYFSGASLALELALGLLIALYFNRAFKGSELVQAIYIIPFAATPGGSRPDLADHAEPRNRRHELPAHRASAFPRASGSAAHRW